MTRLEGDEQAVLAESSGRAVAMSAPRRFKPYPEYRDSGVEWLGEIPGHWEVKKLAWLTHCLDGRRVPLNAEERGTMQGAYPYWGANAIVDYVDRWLFDDERTHCQDPRRHRPPQ